MTGYRPLTLARLAGHVAGASESERWRWFAEFVKEYRHEAPESRIELVQAEPAAIGDERWDTLLAALAEHLAEQDGHGPPDWAGTRSLETFWFPLDTPIARADALVYAPASFRSRGIFLARRELGAA